MQLKKIQAHIAGYKKYLQKGGERTVRPLYKWESQRIWQENWDINASPFAAMYDSCLENSQTRRIWNRENYQPKKMMLAFAELQPHFVYSMFEELFNESKDIGNRVDRFIFYCDQLLKEYKSTRRTALDNDHYHDYEMISHYLAFQYPEQYTPYRFDLFKNTLLQIGSRDIPTANDISRHFKVMKTLHQFLQKDEALIALHQKRLLPIHYQEKSLLLVEDFAFYLKNIFHQVKK
ncbi:MAG: hypothetical protein AAF847_05410 [Bacteroidota bacterium]